MDVQYLISTRLHRNDGVGQHPVARRDVTRVGWVRLPPPQTLRNTRRVLHVRCMIGAILTQKEGYVIEP